ncbi:hypothetical protein [Microbacterium sp. 2FI]|uniref:hypothetical protein n=1 Tax=Microbacterium sp. 2FI TaxID=2502193 RepID=UPI0010F945A6|nr:hypothetical protein [Microbacterium sp. 2FI]
MEKSAASVDEFLASLPDDRQGDMVLLDRLIVERMPDAERVLWEGVFWGGSEQRIIGYGDWSYTRSDRTRVDWFRVGLGMQKNHISVYLNATEDGQYLAKKYGGRLGAVKIGSAAVSFRRVEGVDLGELGRLVSLAAGAGPDGKV